MLRQARRTVVKVVGAGVVCLGAVEVTTQLVSEGRSSRFYHYVSDEVVLPLVRHVLDPEQAHALALEVTRRNWAPRFRPNPLEYHSQVDLSISPWNMNANNNNKKKKKKEDKMVFPSCVGLAAGFDKDGVAMGGLMDMGFGFVEIGSITPQPQPGHPKPRLWRLSDDLAILNRYGFNSSGIATVQQNILDYYNSETESSRNNTNNKPLLPLFHVRDIHSYWTVATAWIQQRLVSVLTYYSPPPPPRRGLLGINLGKNKTSTDEIADYQEGIRQLGPLADYIVINISSPNTPGLVGLQKRDPLRRLLKAAIETRNEVCSAAAEKVTEHEKEPTNSRRHYCPPLLVKISPDLTEEEMVDIAEAVMDCGVDGMVVCNTTQARPDSLVDTSEYETGQEGGLSGVPLRERSTECIRTMYRLTGGKVPIIGVGGVASGHDVYEKLRAGASLVQLYSLLVYKGPGLVSRVRDELAQLMVQNGHRHIQDIVGLDHDEIYWTKRQAEAQQALLLSSHSQQQQAEEERQNETPEIA